MTGTSSEISFAEHWLSGVDLGDRRRQRRLLQSVDAIHAHPYQSLPQKLQSTTMLEGLYRLTRSPRLTHEVLLEGMCGPAFEAALQQAKTEVVLILHDISELDYTSHRALHEELGPIGDGRGRGYHCLTSLLVDPQSREVLGLAAQSLHRRVPAPPREGAASKRNRLTRESRWWQQNLQKLPANWNLVDVIDRGGDSFELLEQELASQRRFVIRSCHDRRIHPGHAPSSEQSLLYALLRGLPAQGQRVWTRKSRGRRGSQEPQLHFTASPVQIVAPHVHRGQHGTDPLSVWVIRVWDPAPPDPDQAVEWILLTNHPCVTPDDIQMVIGWYERRWMIEEFHKALKTGLGVEQLQFATGRPLKAMIALYSLVALSLLNLRAACHDELRAAEPATRWFPALYVEVLSLWRYRQARPLTQREFLMALGRIGGHQNRKRDGLPGWQALWNGWNQLYNMTLGALVMQQQCAQR